MDVRIALLVASAVALAVPDASARGQRWMVDFEVQALDRVLIPRMVGESQPQWYCTYTVTNNTGMDRDLALTLFVETDVARGASGRRRRETRSDAVDPAVQRSVEARLGRDRERPFLDSVQMQGRLRASERKEGIAVFGPVSGEADVILLYVVGLSSAVEERRLGVDYQKMLRGGREVCTVVRGKAGGYGLAPLARRIDVLTYRKLSAEGKTPLMRAVTETEGEAFYALDDERLVAAEPRTYLERTVLRFRYSRRGDERQPQLDLYRLDGREDVLVVEPVSGAEPAR